MKTKKTLGDYVRILAFSALSSIPIIGGGCANYDVYVQNIPITRQPTYHCLANDNGDDISDKELTRYTTTPKTAKKIKRTKEQKRNVILSYIIGALVLGAGVYIIGEHNDWWRKDKDEEFNPYLYPPIGYGDDGDSGSGAK